VIITAIGAIVVIAYGINNLFPPTYGTTDFLFPPTYGTTDFLFPPTYGTTDFLFPNSIQRNVINVFIRLTGLLCIIPMDIE
jgi:hypothetical protein